MDRPGKRGNSFSSYSRSGNGTGSRAGDAMSGGAGNGEFTATAGCLVCSAISRSLPAATAIPSRRIADISEKFLGRSVVIAPELAGKLLTLFEHASFEDCGKAGLHPYDLGYLKEAINNQRSAIK